MQSEPPKESRCGLVFSYRKGKRPTLTSVGQRAQIQVGEKKHTNYFDYSEHICIPTKQRKMWFSISESVANVSSLNRLPIKYGNNECKGSKVKKNGEGIRCGP